MGIKGENTFRVLRSVCLRMGRECRHGSVLAKSLFWSLMAGVSLSAGSFLPGILGK